MMKKLAAVMMVAVVVLAFGGCKKKEEKPQLPAGHPATEGGMPPAGMPKVERAVVVPKDVKAKWKAVKLVVEDKAAKSTKEYTVNVGSDLAIPNTTMTVKVLTFLPHFQMGDKEIKSASNELKMPAAQVSVSDGGKEVWRGWLFSMQPEMHPFQHEKIALKLAGGVAK